MHTDGCTASSTANQPALPWSHIMQANDPQKVSRTDFSAKPRSNFNLCSSSNPTHVAVAAVLLHGGTHTDEQHTYICQGAI